MKCLFLLRIFLCSSLATGFSGSLTTRSRTTSWKVHVLAAAVSSDLNAQQSPASSTNRREALATSLLLVSSASIVVATSGSLQAPLAPTRVLGSVDEALAVIESECDRRFLHAVVASDYKLMHRRLSEDLSLPTIVEKETSDMSTAKFESLERDMANRPIKPSNALLAYTSPQLVNNRVAASVWPLGENVHFAWSENGGALSESVGNMIVDGVDCGRMSLEDALEDKNREIMFRAEMYLAVPVAMEQELITGLRNAFII